MSMPRLVVLCAAAAAGSVLLSPCAQAQRVTISVTDADPAIVINQLAQTLGVKVQVEGLGDRTLTMSLRDVFAKTALKALAESLHCDVEPRTATLLVMKCEPAAPPALARAAGRASLDEPLTLSLKDAQLSEVLETFGQISGRQVVIAPELAGKTIDVEVRERSMREALDAVCRAGGCTWREQPAGVLRFQPR